MDNKTLEIWGKVFQQVDIKFGLLQGDDKLLYNKFLYLNSPVGFCITEIPVAELLEQRKGYRMGEPGKRDVGLTHILFVDDLKVYQESHNLLKEINEVIAQASFDTGARCGVSKCS